MNIVWIVLSVSGVASSSNIIPRTMFVTGPAKEIIPFCFRVTFSPKKYVAPGAAKIKFPIVAIANPSAISNPGYHALYSE